MFVRTYSRGQISAGAREHGIEPALLRHASRAGEKFTCVEMTLYELATIFERNDTCDLDPSGLEYTDDLVVDQFGSHEGAKGMILNGQFTLDKEVADFERAVLAQMPPVIARGRKLRWRDSGDELNVDRALLGNWDQAWRSQTRVWKLGTSVVELCFQWCTFQSWVVAVVALVDILEEAGYQVRVTVSDVATYSGNLGIFSTVLKEADQPFNRAAVQYSICPPNSGSWNANMFRGICYMPWFRRNRMSWGAVEPISEVLPILRATGEVCEGAVYMDTLHGAQTKEVLRILAMFCCEEMIGQGVDLVVPT